MSLNYITILLSILSKDFMLEKLFKIENFSMQISEVFCELVL